MNETLHLSRDQLEAGLEHILASPKDCGVLTLIVRRPKTNEREVLEEGRLDLNEGLVGDKWRRGRSPHPEMQINIMNARAVELVAGSSERRPLAGDQLYIDLDLSMENLPAGTQLAIGEAVVEVTDKAHLGCHKFVSRFGADARKFVNSAQGKQLRLRGLNAKVIKPGVVRTGDVVRKIDASARTT